MRRYVVLRKDGIVVVTDRLKDARKAVNAKYLGCLKRYGNVTELPPSQSLNNALPELSGIYTLDEFKDVLSRIYKSKRTINKHYRYILEVSKKIERKFPEKEKVEPPIKIMIFDSYYDDSLLMYIIRNNSVTYDEIRRDQVYIIEFKNYYALYITDIDKGEKMYISIQKGARMEDIMKYVLDNEKIFNIVKEYVSLIPSLECHRLGYETESLCEELNNYISFLKSIIMLVS
ncbi:MAG: hypothetical protein QXH21_10670 [Ignisphaera sp.]